MLWRGATSWPTWRDGRTMAMAGGNVAKFVFYPTRKAPDDLAMRLTNWGNRVACMGASPHCRRARYTEGERLAVGAAMLRSMRRGAARGLSFASTMVYPVLPIVSQEGAK